MLGQFRNPQSTFHNFGDQCFGGFAGRVLTIPLQRGCERGIEAVGGGGLGLLELRLRADLRPGRQVGFRMPVGQGIFRRRGAFSRTWHGSKTNEPAFETKEQLGRLNRRRPAERVAGPGMPELVCTGVTALNVVRRAEEEWKDAVQLLSCFNVTLSRWATSFQDRVAPARVCDGFDVGLVGSALAPGEGAKAGQGRE